MIKIRLANIVDETQAEGPGKRMAFWVQGCSIRCTNCCNPEMFDPTLGTDHLFDDLTERMTVNKTSRKIEGITILGGEPFDQAFEAGFLAKTAQKLGLTVMVFSGYTLTSLRRRQDAKVNSFINNIDLLVDGPYNHKMPEPPPPIGRRWIGSSNQIMHYLTNAYSDADPRMRSPNTVEIRLTKKKLDVNGWPSADKLINKVIG